MIVRAAVFLIALALALVFFGAAVLMVLFSPRRLRRRAVGDVWELDADRVARISLTEGIWEIAVHGRRRKITRFTSAHELSRDPRERLDLHKFRTEWFWAGSGGKVDPEMAAWLNDRRDEYIHGLDKASAEYRKIVNRPLGQ